MGSYEAGLQAVNPQATKPRTPLTLLQHRAQTELRGLAEKIDQEGHYPLSFLQAYGREYGFGQAVDRAYGGQGLGLHDIITGMEECSRECVATGFLIWCQTACAWYLQHSANAALKRKWLPAICSGSQTAGTGLSNLLKARSELEPLRLRATETKDGYYLNGSLPWVSNLAPGGVFAIAALTSGGGIIMAIVRTDAPGLTLRRAGPFLALEGTSTMSCRFTNVLVGAGDLIVEPDGFEAYFEKMRAGLILTQMGMALGLAQACVALIEESSLTPRPANAFLEHQPKDLQTRLDALRRQTLDVARALEGPSPPPFEATLRVRAQGSVLALDAAQSALLHLGACGYLRRHPAQRKLREAYFVAIVTPALKHIARELSRTPPSVTGRETA